MEALCKGNITNHTPGAHCSSKRKGLKDTKELTARLSIVHIAK